MLVQAMRAEYLVHLARHGCVDIHPGGEAATNALLAALRLEDDSRVLEIGCGTGYTLTRLLARPGVFATGLDFSPEMLQVTRRRLRWAGYMKRAALIRAKAQDLPLPDETFDHAYAESVLGFQDTDDIRSSLHEIFRVLRPGGVFVANDAIWNDRLDPAALTEINQSCIDDFGLRQSSEHAWTQEDWLNEFRNGGFEVMSARLLGDLRQANVRVHRPPFAADLALWPRRVSNFLSPAQRATRRRYRELIERHAPEAELTDAVMFVVRKPS